MTRRSIPSIEQVRQRPAVTKLEKTYGRAAVVDALRAAADHLRADVSQGIEQTDMAAAVEALAAKHLRLTVRPSLTRVLNATGVIIHTNLGRSPLSRRASEAVAQLASGYTNLEYDLDKGSRGRRDVHAEHLICRLTGAQAACVVNNNAAAALLTLAALAAGREAIVSRGELVEIGGGFRVPDVMAQSGAILREVGTTNRTRAADYAAAISDRTALILRVHPSNFRIEGFTERPTATELVAIGRRFNIPVAEDLGSGYLGSDASALRDEPTVAGTLAAGVDVVMFSGDKLLGGPQAGIIVGRHDAIESIRRHPLMRALRVDKMTYAALEATLLDHVSGRSSEIPVARMIAMSVEDVRTRAQRLSRILAAAGLASSVMDGQSTIGGGSAPGTTLATALVRLETTHGADALERRLRSLDPPVIARIEDGHVVLDLRTVLEQDDDLLASVLTEGTEETV